MAEMSNQIKVGGVYCFTKAESKFQHRVLVKQASSGMHQYGEFC